MIRKAILITLVSFLMLAPFSGLVSTCLARGGGGGGGGRGGGGMGGGGMGGGAFTTTGTAAGRSTTGTSSSAIVGADSAATVRLVPVPERKWIVVTAPPDIMKQIADWIDIFDSGENIPTDYDTVTVKYVDAANVADSITAYLQQLEGQTGIAQSAYVQALTESRQLLIFGKKDSRDMVKKLVAELDLPAGLFERESIPIRFADPEDIKTKIDEYYGYLGTSGGSSSTGTSTGTRTTISRTSSISGATTLSANYVSVIVFPSLRQITVIASKENMEKVKQLIKEWDQPLDPEKIKPRIITLHNMDPADMVTLLTNLFGSSTTSSGTSSNSNTRTVLQSAYGTSATDAAKIVGQLYGKLTFANVTGTRKIIVISNIPEAYDVIETFIKAIDTEEVAQTPRVIQLKYADSEDICRRLNVLFADTGQQAQLTATTTGLTMPSSMSTTTSSGSTSSTAQTITFPWSSASGGASSTSTSTLKVSNIYGKARFVPEPSTKSILLLAPEQFLDDLEDLIHELDIAGKQVIIKTAIVEVSHEKLGNIGVEFTSGGTLDKGGIFSIGPTANYSPQTSGRTTTTSTSGTTTSIANVGTLIERGDFTLTGITASTLIDFLVNQVNGRVLNQQTLWTKDNTEAQFFKGKTVPIITGQSSTTNTSGNLVVTNTYTRTAIGMEVRVRPMITPENNVQMIVNVSYSQLAGTDVSGQTITSNMATTTNMVVQNGNALILGGILFQTDTSEVSKIPGLGDIPVIGPILFGHTKTGKSTNELLVFLTPYVIDAAPTELDKLNLETLQQIEDPRERIEAIKKSLRQSTRELEPNSDSEEE